MDASESCMITVAGSPTLSCNRRKYAMIPSSSSASSYQEKEPSSNNTTVSDSIDSHPISSSVLPPAHMTSSVNSNSVTYQNIRILKLSSEKYSITGQPVVSPCIPFMSQISSPSSNTLPVSLKPTQNSSNTIKHPIPIRPYSKRSFRKQTLPSQKLPSVKETLDEDIEEDSNAIENECNQAVSQPGEIRATNNLSPHTNSNLNITTTHGNKPIVRYKIYMVNEASRTTFNSSLEKRQIQITNNTRMYQSSSSVSMQNSTGPNYAQNSNYIDEDLVRLHVNLKKVLYKH